MPFLCIVKDIGVFLLAAPIVSTLAVWAGVFWIWKQIVYLFLLLKHRNKLGGYLSPVDLLLYSLVTTGDFKLVPGWAIPMSAILEGNLTAQELKAHFQNVINQRDEKGHFKYARLQQRIDKKCGYMMFIQDGNFKLESHIRTVNVSQNEQSATEFIKTENSKPMKSDAPLWEIILVPNYNGEDKTLAIFRCYHAFFDGFSILSILKQGCDGAELFPKRELKPTELMPVSLKNCMKKLYFRSLGLPRKYLIEQSERKNLPSRQNFDESFVHPTWTIPMERFKQHKRETGISLSLTVCTALSHALSELVAQKQEKIDYLTGFLTFPSPKYKGDEIIGNNFILPSYNFPTDVFGFTDGIQKCRSEMSKTVDSVSPVVSAMLNALRNAFPASLYAKYFAPDWSKLDGIAISNMPGPNVATKYLGHNVIDGNFQIPAGLRPWLYVCLLSYNGNMNITLSGHSSIFEKQENFENFCRNFKNVLENILTKNCTENSFTTLDLYI